MGGVSVAALLGRLVVSLGIVIAVMAVLARVARNRLGRTSARGLDPALHLQVLSRQTIGKNASVLLVRSGDRGLLLGVTEHTVSLLGETDIPPAEEPVAQQPSRTVLTPNWGGFLQRARDVTVRRV
jgi:flagellar protein FliO/FliZ